MKLAQNNEPVVLSQELLNNHYHILSRWNLCGENTVRLQLHIASFEGTSASNVKYPARYSRVLQGTFDLLAI